MEKKKHGNSGKKHSEITKLKIAKGLIGNINAEKYTLDDSFILFSEIIKETQSISNHTLNKICKSYGVPVSLISKLVTKFPELKDLYDLIKSNLENNCIESANNDILKLPIALANLKANYNWSDRLITNNTSDITSGGQPLQMNNLITFISDDNSDEETDE